MAVFNGERYVSEAIESILKQTYRDFEFIIVNDASTDKTEEIIKAYQQQDSRILLINNTENQERALSRNKGIEIARGEYISIIDYDDVSLPEKLTCQVQYLDIHADVGFVGTRWYYVDKNSEILSIGDCSDVVSHEAVHFMCNPSIMARKACIERTGGYRSVLVPAEDYDLWLRVADFSKGATISEPLFLYRVHSGSSTSLQKAKMEVASVLAIEMADERKRTGCDTFSRSSLEDAARIVQQRLRSSSFSRRKKLAKSQAFQSEAALVIGDYKLAFSYATQALLSFPGCFRAWYVMGRILSQHLTIAATGS